MITMFSTIPKCQYFPLSNSLPPDNPENYRQLFLLQPHCLTPSNVFWEDSIKQVLFFMGALFLYPVLLLKLKPNRSLNIWNVCIHTMGSKAGTTLGEEVELKIKKLQPHQIFSEWSIFQYLFPFFFSKALIKLN